MDTVVVTSPDVNSAVLQPSLTDAIGAAQLYYLLVLAAKEIVIAAEQQANISAALAQAAANEAIAASATAATTAAAAILFNLAAGTPTMATRVKLQRQLALDGNLQTVRDYVGNNYTIDSAQSLEWESASFVPAPGILYAAIKAALSYSDAQALTLWNNAYLLS